MVMSYMRSTQYIRIRTFAHINANRILLMQVFHAGNISLLTDKNLR